MVNGAPVMLERRVGTKILTSVAMDSGLESVGTKSEMNQHGLNFEPVKMYFANQHRIGQTKYGPIRRHR
jgi:hypothetical protein